MTGGWVARLVGECLRHRALVVITLAVTGVGVVIDLGAPLLTRAAIDDATGVATHGVSIAAIASALAVLGVVRFAAQFIRRLTAGRLSLTVQNTLRRGLLATLLRLDGTAQDSISTGQVVSRSISDLQLVQGLLSMVPLSLGALVQVVLAFCVMAYLSPLLTVVALIVIPAVALVAFRTRKALFAATWAAQQSAADVAQHVEETVTGVRVVKGFGQERRSVDELVGHGRRLFSLRMRAAGINSRFAPTMGAIPQVAMVGVIALGGYLTARGDITVGTFLAFATYISTMTSLARLLTNLIVSAQLARAAVERVFDVIDQPADPALDNTAVMPPGSVGVRLRGVGFRHGSDPDNGRAIFSGLDLHVAPGECVAVVGPPGSGKSTLAALLGGVYTATDGTVELTVGSTGYEIGDLNPDEVHRRVGVVVDEPFLYSDTIAANISVGPRTHDAPDVSAAGVVAADRRARVSDAARRASAHDFITALPDGYDTVVGERGLTLSGGQRQRIAVARALYADPPLLVLDDATSAVDATTEVGILGSLRSTPGRTMVVLAHRRSTLTLADRVAVLDAGRVIDTGTPEELDRRCPLFRSLMSNAVGPADEVAGPDHHGRQTQAADVDRLWPSSSRPQVDRSASDTTSADQQGADDSAGFRTRVGAAGASRRGGGGVAGALGSMPATPAVLDAVAALPPATEKPSIDEQGARAHDPEFSLRRMLAPVRWLLAGAILAITLDTLVGLAFPSIARVGVNAASSDHLSSLWIASAVGLVLVAAGWVATSVMTILSSRAGERVLLTLRIRSYAHLQRLGLDYYERELSGRIMTRMTTDIDALSSFLQTGLSTAVVAVLTIVGVALALVLTDPTLGALMLLVFPPLIVATVVFQRVSSRAYTRSRELISSVNADFQENVAGLRTTIANRHVDAAESRFADRAAEYVRARMVSQRAISLYFPFITLCSDIATAGVIAFGAHQVSDGATGAGTLVAFVLYLGMLFGPVQQLSQVFDGYQQAVVGLRRIGDLLRTRSSVSVDAGTDPAAMTPGTPGLEFTGHAGLADVRFRYDNAGDDALRGVSIDIPAGSSLALVGQTGAGKSTIVKLLARFYDPTSGSVTMDGRDIRGYPLDGYRARLGVVPQEPHLFTGTVASNIAYGRPDADRAAIAAAAFAVGAIDMIADLRGGMEHRVGERGQGLSAGQRQLIALARAELVDPDLLLLDEATATLDQATERAVLAAGRHLTGSRTSVIVAHRLATAARADRIAVVSDGRITELGTHDELLAMHGKYRELWDAGVTRVDGVPAPH